MYTNKLLRLKPNYSITSSEYTATFNGSIRLEKNASIALRSIFLQDVKSQQIILQNDVKFSVKYKQDADFKVITIPKGSYDTPSQLAIQIQNSLNASTPSPYFPNSISSGTTYTGFCWNCVVEGQRFKIQYDHSSYNTPEDEPTNFSTSKCSAATQIITATQAPTGDGSTFAYPSNASSNPGCATTQWSYTVGNNNTSLQFLCGYVKTENAGQSNYVLSDFMFGFGCDANKKLFTIVNGVKVTTYNTYTFANSGVNSIANCAIYHKPVVGSSISQWYLGVTYRTLTGTSTLEILLGNNTNDSYIAVTSILSDVGDTYSQIQYDYLNPNPFLIFNTDTGDLVDKPFLIKYANTGLTAPKSSIITFDFPQQAQDALGFNKSYVVSGVSGQIVSIYGIANSTLNDIVVELNGIMCESYDSSSEYGYSRAIIGCVDSILPVGGNILNANDYSTDIVNPPYVSLRNKEPLELTNFNIRILSDNIPINCGSASIVILVQEPMTK